MRSGAATRGSVRANRQPTADRAEIGAESIDALARADSLASASRADAPIEEDPGAKTDLLRARRTAADNPDPPTSVKVVTSDLFGVTSV